MGKRHIWSAGSRGMGERKIAAGREVATHKWWKGRANGGGCDFVIL